MQTIPRKSRQDIAAMRRAGAVVGDTLRLVREMSEPGVRLRDINKAAEALIRARGATPTFKGYHGFPAALCMSVNEQVIHGIPGRRKLKAGDILSVDCGATLDGWVGDSAITVGVGAVDARKQLLMDTTRASLMAGIAAARPGARLGDIGSAIEAVVMAQGFGLVREYCGHGVGRALHEDPQVPNYGSPGTGPVIESGWCLALEPLVTMGGDDVVALSDGWTIITRDRKPAAHFELAIAITDEGNEILTLTSDDAYP